MGADSEIGVLWSDLGVVGHPTELCLLEEQGVSLIDEFAPPHLEIYENDCGLYRDDLAYVRATARQLHAKRIADLGCGSGRLLVELIAHGTDEEQRTALAVDRSPFALRELERRLQACGALERVVIVCCSIEDVRPAAKGVDLAILGFDNVTYFPNWSSLLSGFSAIQGLLVDGGRLLIDFRAPPAHLPTLPSPICISREVFHAKAEHPITLLEFTSPSASPFLVRKRLAFRTGGSTYMTKPVIQRFWTAEEIRNALEHASFVIEREETGYGAASSEGGSGWRWLQILARG